METKAEADECVVNTKSLSINGRPVFARISLPQSQLDQKKKDEIEEKKAKRDKRNLALAREGEIREGTEAWKVSFENLLIPLCMVKTTQSSKKLF